MDQENPPAHNLPVQRTDFVGRQQERWQVQTLLDRSRLVTLTGSGGMGKTRLALQVAAALLPDFFDGVRFVSLAEIRNADLIPAQISQALGVPEGAAPDPLANLIAFLRDKHMLLVLDNFEQVIAGAPLVPALLAAAPDLRVLVTSREALHVDGEHIWAVPPLAVPDLHQLPPLADLVHNEAVQLFTARAQAARFDFALTPANAVAVAALCVALDGIPLAIELAAARASTLTPQEMLQQVDHRLALLDDGLLDRPPRHETLRGALAWSYDLLPAGEQLLFARLAVFVAGGSLPAVQAICNADGALSPDLRADLAALADKSLLQRVFGATGEARFQMLETIREYAEEQLAARREVQRLRCWHADYFCRWLAAAEPDLRGSLQQATAFRQVEEESGNLHTALRWALDAGEAATALGIGGILWRVWAVRSDLAEGRRRLAAILMLAPPPAGRARVLQGIGALAMFQGDYAAAQIALAESRALYQALADQQGLAETLADLGKIALDQGQHRTAQALLNESIALQRARDDRRGLARGLADLALLQEAQGQWAAAIALLEESYILRRDLGSTEGMALVLCRLGDVLRAQGAWEQAAGAYEESLARYRELGHRAGIAALLHNLGQIQLQRGAPRQALALFTESLSLLHDGEELQLISYGLAGVAEALVALSHPGRAARLFGTVAAALESQGIQLAPADQAVYDQHCAQAQAQLDAAGWAGAWDAGRARPLAAALAYALEEMPLD